VIFEHCPFASLRPEYPVLCQIDTNLLEYIVDEPVRQIATEAYLPDGYCLFNISPRKGPGEPV
jgi:predicted ArsR family transcriptional regulator